jgi:glucose-6-phosphate 1-dehydrogenase
MDHTNSDLTTIVIFGASGDLNRRKLIPSLFSLHLKRKLPGGCRLIGFSTSKWTDEEFRAEMRSGLDEFSPFQVDEDEWDAFAKQLSYVPGSFSDRNDFTRLAQELEKYKGVPDNRLYYLAAPPRFFSQIIENMDDAGLVQEKEGFRRVVIEKPFGRDLKSAQELNQQIHRSLDERQIFRIDHYLGKETVQNVMVFRFANAMFEPVWNRNYIDHVQITVAEDVGVDHRAKFYDNVGIMRDMFQNHLFQLLTLVAMEPPATFEADALRNEKKKVLSAVRPILSEQIESDTIRGQYRGYLDKDGVSPNSQTATYAALRFYIDNWRWQGVPFFLRSGKKLKKKTSEIVIQYKRPPHVMFPMPKDQDITANILAICLQPDEGIHATFEAKVPDSDVEMKSVPMDFKYAESFGESAIPDAYERLILDAVMGDASLFTRSDQIETGWELVDPIIQGWLQGGKPELAIYEPGSWGPAEADEFMARSGRRWRIECAGEF